MSARFAQANSQTGGFDEAEIARLLALPGFVETVRASAKAMSDLYRNVPILNAILNDRGRFIISAFALYLHYASERDRSVSLTAGRLKAMAVEQGMGSPGRVAAVIALMRWGGYLAPAPMAPGERSERLQVTPKLLAVQTERWRAQFRAMSRLFPEAAEAMERLDDPRFVSACALAQAAEFLSGFRFIDHAPEVAPFIDRYGGFMILLSLMAAGSGSERAAPEETSISVSALARRFGVSRPHVNAIFRDAQEKGLLERSGDQVKISLELSRGVERFFALVYLLNLDCLRQGLAACRD